MVNNNSINNNSGVDNNYYNSKTKIKANKVKKECYSIRQDNTHNFDTIIAVLTILTWLITTVSITTVVLIIITITVKPKSKQTKLKKNAMQ